MKEKGIKIVRTDTDRPETIQWYIKKASTGISVDTCPASRKKIILLS